MELELVYAMNLAAIALALLSCRSCWLHVRLWLFNRKKKIRADACDIVAGELFQSIFRPCVHRAVLGVVQSDEFEELCGKYALSKRFTDVTPLLVQIFNASVIPDEVRATAYDRGVEVLQTRYGRMSPTMARKYINEAYYTVDVPGKTMLLVTETMRFSMRMTVNECFNNLYTND